MPRIVLKVTALGAQAKWASKSIDTTPVGDLLLAVDVPDEEATQDETGATVITQKGVQRILRGLEGMLVADVEEFT